MSRFKNTIPSDYFDDLYAANADPWTFATSAYERTKYAATLEALPRTSYESGLELGCSIGVLTASLAPRCKALIALDIAEAPLDAARARCVSLPQVKFERGSVPGDWPNGSFDLILLSEIVYYLDERDVDRLAERVLRSIMPKGDILLVHWLGETNYPLSGDEAATRFINALEGHVMVVRQERQAQYRLDLLQA